MRINYQDTITYAQELDQQDKLASFKREFHHPVKKGKEVIYLCGNSLGLQPKNARVALEKELKKWAEKGVDGHFEGNDPWFKYHHTMKKTTAEIFGAKPLEVVIMNNLTVNLHLMMVSFYRPKGQRRKIIIESGAFPSDQYAVESQIKFHGFDPEQDLIELKPREGEYTLRTEDIIGEIEEEGDKVALVMLGGINYYTGQFFDLEKIAKAAHQVGAFAGYDLAHAAGNVPLQLHDWDVDFAVWCTYKYMNSGPGGTSGVFVHEKHANEKDIPRFAGWWGHNEEERFLMNSNFDPMIGADGWQLSCSQVLPMAVHRASLEIFEKAGFNNLVEKSRLLTGYLFYLMNLLIDKYGTEAIKIITPSNPDERGCQISLIIPKDGKKVFDALYNNNVVVDWREPDVIRVAPVPLYNTFEEVYIFYSILEKVLKDIRFKQ